MRYCIAPPSSSAGSVEVRRTPAHEIDRSTPETLPCPHGPRSGVDVGREVLPGEGGAGGDEVGRCALEDDPTAVAAGAGTEVDDPVGVRHDRLMGLDDDDRRAGVDEHGR